MACRLFGAKQLSKPMRSYCQLDLGTNFSDISFKIQKLFIDTNASENIVWEMAAIFVEGEMR